MTDQQHKFDLIQQPWLPCLDLNGKSLEHEVNLRDVFANAPEVSAIQGETPLVTISLYRLLIAILLAALRHANQAPRRAEEWASLWSKKTFDMDLCDSYFSSVPRDRFDLFHSKHPFYQSLDAQGKEDEKGNSFSKRMPDMMHEIAWGNNPTLFDHRFESTGFALSPAQAARRLVTIQVFGLGGLSGFSKKNFRIAPLVKDVILLAQGDNLFETLMLNLPLTTKKKEKGDFPSWDTGNRPDWEETRSADYEEGYLPRGVLDYLTWQNRLVWLKPENPVTQMKMSRGYSLKMDRIEEVELEPMKSYYRREKKDGTGYFVPIVWDERQALWRNSATLLNVHVERGDRPPHAFKLISDALTLPNSPLDPTHRYRFSAFGLAPNQASVEFYRQETFPLPLEYLRSEKVVEKLKDNLKEAEKMGRKLKGACDYIKKQLYPSDGSDRARQVFADGVLRRYWSQLETMFSSMMVRTAQDDVTRDEETIRWRSEVNMAVYVAFEEAIIGLGMSARSYWLYVRGVEKIWGNPIKRKKQNSVRNGGDDMPQDNPLFAQAKRFVAYLRQLKQSDRGAGAMAELRHALSHDVPLDAQPAFKYVARWLNSEGIGTSQPWLIQPLCLIAALYALHSENVDEGNMGTHMAQLCSGSNKMNVESVERRFGRLLETPSDNLQDYLSQVIRLLKSHEVPVNWARLLVDIRQWNEPTYANEVRRYWAREFWFRVSENSKKS